MKYYKHYYGDDYENGKEVTYEDALRTLISVYRNNDMTRDMLTIPNRIRTRFCDVVVEGAGGNKPHPDALNELPDGIEYDEDGIRI